VLDAVDIFALIAKLERIGRHFRQRDVVPGLVVEDGLQPRCRAHAHVVVRAGYDELVGLDVLVEHELPGIRALDPQILRRLAAQDVADFRPDHIGEPIHVSLRIAIKSSSPLNLYGGPHQTRQAAVGGLSRSQLWLIPQPVWLPARRAPAKPRDRLPPRPSWWSPGLRYRDCRARHRPARYRRRRHWRARRWREPPAACGCRTRHRRAIWCGA